MFDIAWSELLVIGAVALVVIGPKDLPKVLKTIGQIVAKARGMAREFQGGLDDMIRESELDELRKTVAKATDFNPATELNSIVDPKGEIAGALEAPVIEAPVINVETAAPPPPAIDLATAYVPPGDDEPPKSAEPPKPATLA